MKPYRIIAIESSPYACKIRAVMRYRRIPYQWVARMPQYFSETAGVRPLIMPVVQFPDGAYHTDSTPIIHDLETRHPDTRSTIPPRPGAAFLSDLIEDMADEWLTKCLFHHRFSHVRDRRCGAAWVIDDAHPQASRAELEPLIDEFVGRQVARMPLVGCTPDNAALIEEFYLDVLAILEPFVASGVFLFGSRPALADFGLYGQLSTLARDPTPAAILLSHAPRTLHWVRRLDDASGLEGEWDDDVSPAVAALVGLAGRYYLPFLSANTRALANGEAQVTLELAGRPYTQAVYRYQGKCHDFLRRRYQALHAAAKAELASLLEESDCLRHLEA